MIPFGLAVITQVDATLGLRKRVTRHIQTRVLLTRHDLQVTVAGREEWTGVETEPARDAGLHVRQLDLDHVCNDMRIIEGRDIRIRIIRIRIRKLYCPFEAHCLGSS